MVTDMVMDLVTATVDMVIMVTMGRDLLMLMPPLVTDTTDMVMAMVTDMVMDLVTAMVDMVIMVTMARDLLMLMPPLVMDTMDMVMDMDMVTTDKAPKVYVIQF